MENKHELPITADLLFQIVRIETINDEPVLLILPKIAELLAKHNITKIYVGQNFAGCILVGFDDEPSLEIFTDLLQYII